MRRFEYTDAAKQDLAKIHERIVQQDAVTASLVVDRIEETIQSVCVFPQMGKLTKQSSVWVFGGSRKCPFRITYRFDDEVVSVVRIFRAKRESIQF